MNVVIPAAIYSEGGDLPSGIIPPPAPAGATRLAYVPTATFEGWDDLEEILLRFQPDDHGQLTIPLDRTLLDTLRGERPRVESSAREMERELRSENYRPWDGATQMVYVDWNQRKVIIRFRVTHFRTTNSPTRTPNRFHKILGPLSRSLMRSSQSIARSSALDDMNRQLTLTRDPRFKPIPRRSPGATAQSQKEALAIDRSNYKKALSAIGAGVTGLVLPNLGRLVLIGALIWFFMDPDSFIDLLGWITKVVVDKFIKPILGGLVDAAGNVIEGALPDPKTMMMYAAAGGIVLVGIMMLTKR